MNTARSMRVGGVVSHLHTDEPAFDAALDLWLRPDPIDEQPGRLAIELAIGPPTLPARPATREHGLIRLWHDGSRIVVSDGVSFGWLDPDVGAITLHAPDASVDACWMALHRCLRPLLGVALAQLGRFGVHAGAVGIDDHAVVILGASGAGKSTLTSHLADAGATFLADDSIYVSTPPLTVAGWPERTRLRCSHDHAPGLPDGKAAHSPGTSDSAPHPPRLLLVLAAHPDQGEPTTTMPPADVMAYLLQASTFALDPTIEPARLAALAALATVPALALPPRPRLPTLQEVAEWIPT